MAHTLPNDSQYGVHLRSSSASGGQDWVGSIDSNRVMTSQWGKTGNINQYATKKGGPVELSTLKHEKISKGYTQIDEYTPNTGWDSQPITSTDITRKKEPRQYVAPEPVADIFI